MSEEAGQDHSNSTALRMDPVPEHVSLGWAFLAEDPPRVEWSTFTPAETGFLEARLEDETARILAMAPEPAAETEQPFCAGCPGLARICPVSRTLGIKAATTKDRGESAELR